MSLAARMPLVGSFPSPPLPQLDSPSRSPSKPTDAGNDPVPVPSRLVVVVLGPFCGCRHCRRCRSQSCHRSTFCAALATDMRVASYGALTYPGARSLYNTSSFSADDYPRKERAYDVLFRPVVEAFVRMNGLEQCQVVSHHIRTRSFLCLPTFCLWG